MLSILFHFHFTAFHMLIVIDHLHIQIDKHKYYPENIGFESNAMHTRPTLVSLSLKNKPVQGEQWDMVGVVTATNS